MVAEAVIIPKAADLLVDAVGRAPHLALIEQLPGTGNLFRSTEMKVRSHHDATDVGCPDGRYMLLWNQGPAELRLAAFTKRTNVAGGRDVRLTPDAVVPPGMGVVVRGHVFVWAWLEKHAQVTVREHNALPETKR